MLKRTVAAIASTALLATSVLSSAVAAKTATADPFHPATYGVTGALTQVVGFDGYDVDTNLVTAGIVTDSNTATQTLTIADGGLSGKALQWHAVAADSKRVTIPLQVGDRTDWTGAQELWVYVDQSAYLKPGSTNYTQNSNSFGLGFVAGGAAVQYTDGAAVGKITLNETQRLAADVNGDGNITVSDVRRILRYAVGKITSFD